ncbi:MAG: complex I NDUFA9 subunit family protein [Chloroflexota bacterium]
MAQILLTGPSGFVGSHVLPALLDAGHQVRGLVRDAAAADRVRSRLAPAHATAVTFATGDVTQPETLGPALDGLDTVIHLVAIARDWNGGKDLERINTGGTANVLAAMGTAGVKRLIHLGAMGVVDDPKLNYARTKARAEAAVAGSGLDWTTLKPSLMWGERDGFFNVIASLVRTSPGVVPVPAGQHAKFQPISVDDLARIVVLALERPETVGRSFDIGGPDLWTYEQMVREVLTAMGAKRAILPMPLALIKLVARTAEAVHLPFPVASDQLRQLAFDNAAASDIVQKDWGFTPRAMHGNLGYLRNKPKQQEPAPVAA